MLGFVPGHLKTKTMCRHAVKKLLFVIRYVLNQCYKMRDKVILENTGTLKSVPDCYKNKIMFYKAVDNYAHALDFVPECCKTQKMCDKVANSFFSTMQFVPEFYKTENIYDKAVDICSFVFYSVFDVYKI